MEQVIIILNQFFQWVLTTSAMASVMVGFILLAKLILKDKLNIRWHYFLWILVIARLILPWTPESSFSVFNLVDLKNSNKEMNQPIAFSENTSHQVEGSILSPNTLQSKTETTYSEQSKQQAAAGESEMVAWFSLIMFAWLSGVFSLFTYIYVSNKRFAGKVNSGTQIQDQRILQILDQCKNSMRIRKNISLIKTSVINSPTLYGSIRPRLLLPEKTIHTFTDHELTYIFCHELAHFKRKDIAVNWFMTSLLILHWFNPILWYAYFRMREDQEMACDALALTFIHPNESTQYGYTIIKLLDGYSRFPSTPGVASFSGKKSQLKRRIRMIRLFRKTSYKWSILGLAIIILLSVFALTNAKSVEKQDESWKVRTEYVEKDKVVFSVFPDPKLSAGKPYGYMIHFTAPFETFKGKKIAIYAYHKETGTRVTALPPQTISKPSPGYSSLNRFTTNFSLSLTGLWRYEVVLNDHFYGDVVLPVNEPSDSNPRSEQSKKEETSQSDEWQIISRGYRVQGVIENVEITSNEIRSITLKVQKNIPLENSPVDYDFEGQTLQLMFDNEKVDDDLKGKLKQGANIVVTFAQYAIPPDGKVVMGSRLDSDWVLYEEDGSYYNSKGDEVSLTDSKENTQTTIRYLEKNEALNIAKKMNGNGNAKYEAEFKEDYKGDPDNKEIPRPVWIVTALYPFGNKTIFYIDAHSGAPLSVAEIEAPHNKAPNGASPSETEIAQLQQYTPAKLALRDYRGASLDLVANSVDAVADGIRALGGRVDYPSPPIHPTPGYELTLKGPNGQEAVLSYVGNGNWQVLSEATADYVEGKALADAVQAALPVPSRKPGDLEYLFEATELKVSRVIEGIPDAVWNGRRQVVVRVLRDLGTPQNDGSVPREQPLKLIFTVRGQTETVEVWADAFRYGGRVYQAGQILRTLAVNMSTG